MLLWLLLGVAGFILLVIFYYYNKFAVLSNRIDNSLSQINVQLKRRADLIPNLVESVKGFMKHERAAIKAVTDARKALVGARDIVGKVKADNVLENALSRLFAIAEGYPDLKANTNFLELQRELSSTEDRIAYARQFYNDSILSYNNLCTTFPGRFFSKLFHRQLKDYLEITEKEKKLVKVEF